MNDIQSIIEFAWENRESLQEKEAQDAVREVIEKLELYQALGVDEFIYYASLGLGLKEQKRSLELFCQHVIPAFR